MFKAILFDMDDTLLAESDEMNAGFVEAMICSFDGLIHKLEFIVLDVGACDGDRTSNGNADERRAKDAQ